MAKVAAGQSRPFNLLFLAIFAILTATGLWLMRVYPALNEVPTGLELLVETGIPGHGTPWKTSYTGIASFDAGLKMFVAAFLVGPISQDRGIILQQLHFLLQFFSVLCVWNVEACRQRNAYRAISL